MLGKRLDLVEEAIFQIAADFRSLRKETRALRRTARIASRTRVFFRGLNRCAGHKMDRLHLWGRKQFTRWFLPFCLVYAGYQAVKQGKVMEWMAKLWAP